MNRSIDRIEKLLRLAAPTSGATEPERVSAALEASRLFAQGGFVVSERDQQKAIPRSRTKASSTTSAQAHRRTAPTPSPMPTQPPPGWHRSIAIFDSYCIDPDCGLPIQQGEEVWSRIVGNVRIEYIHLGGECGW